MNLPRGCPGQRYTATLRSQALLDFCPHLSVKNRGRIGCDYLIELILCIDSGSKITTFTPKHRSAVISVKGTLSRNQSKATSSVSARLVKVTLAFRYLNYSLLQDL
jgi:hypothetical protein